MSLHVMRTSAQPPPPLWHDRLGPLPMVPDGTGGGAFCTPTLTDAMSLVPPPLLLTARTSMLWVPAPTPPNDVDVPLTCFQPPLPMRAS